MKTSDRNSILKKLVCTAALFGTLVTTGCSDTYSSKGIYGIYDGTAANYAHGGAVTQVVDNGFSSGDEFDHAVSQSRPTGPAPVDKHDTLVGRTADTLEGNGGSDPLSAKQSVQTLSSSGSLSGSGDGLDPDGGAPKSSDPDSNFYDYYLTGNIVDSSVEVRINDARVPVNTGHVDNWISESVHPGINKVEFLYTPTDDTSSAILEVRKGAPVPPSVRFDSHIYMLDGQSTDPENSQPKVCDKISYFFAD